MQVTRTDDDGNVLLRTTVVCCRPRTLEQVQGRCTRLPLPRPRVRWTLAGHRARHKHLPELTARVRTVMLCMVRLARTPLGLPPEMWAAVLGQLSHRPPPLPRPVYRLPPRKAAERSIDRID